MGILAMHENYFIFCGKALLLYYDAIGKLMSILAMHENYFIFCGMHFFYTMMQLVT